MKIEMLLSLSIFLSVFSSSAGAADSLSLVAERSLPTGREKISITFEGNSVTHVSNSNFLSEAASKARIGTYRSKLTPMLRTDRLMLKNIASRALRKEENLKKRSPELAEKGSENSAHAIRWKVNGKRVAPSPIDAEDFQRILEVSRRIGEWKPESGALAEISKAGKLTIHYEGGKKNGKVEKPAKGCESHGKTFSGVDKRFCLIPGIGSVYLTPPKN